MGLGQEYGKKKRQSKARASGDKSSRSVCHPQLVAHRIALSRKGLLTSFRDRTGVAESVYYIDRQRHIPYPAKR